MVGSGVRGEAMRPLRLRPNPVRRFYRGGPRIDDLRGTAGGYDGCPEDWVGSTTTVRGEATTGLGRLDDGRLVRDVVGENPEAILGPAHVARWGANPALLVKLLDAGERLPVHFHPDRRFARTHLHGVFGKTEAWIVVEAEPGASVYVGLREPTDPDTVAGWVARQDVGAMLAALHPIPVRAGDVVFVPAGTPHAIGAGILVVELQEPTDLSILLEFDRFGVDDGSQHLGLGWPLALRALDYGSAHADDLVHTSSGGEQAGVSSVFSDAANPYFRAQRVRPVGGSVLLEPSFAILVVLAGTGRLRIGHDDELALRRGDCLLVPHAAGATTVDGDVDAIRNLPPDPTAPAGPW